MNTEEENNMSDLNNKQKFGFDMPNSYRSKKFVIRRNGTITPYEDNKIFTAIAKAFQAVEGEQALKSEIIQNIITEIVQTITNNFETRRKPEENIHIEDIQDKVELELTRISQAEKYTDIQSLLFKVAKSYIVYREERSKARETDIYQNENKHNISVTLESGKKLPLPIVHIKKLLDDSCHELSEVNSDILLQEVEKNIYDGISEKELANALVMIAKQYIEKEPNYSYVSARLLLNNCAKYALNFLGLTHIQSVFNLKDIYSEAFAKTITKGIELKLLDNRLLEFNLQKLGAALQAERDFKFSYLSLQTLYDRYFLHSNNIRIELPQIFFMRVAMGLALNEKNKNDKAIEFYNLISSFNFMSSTPTLFNSGTTHPQLSSCYLLDTEDDLSKIFDLFKYLALLSKHAGGLGVSWQKVRALGARVAGTNGKSQGVVPFLKVANDTAVAVDQGGKRKGALCNYLSDYHKDILEFLELRKNTGDDRRRTHDTNTAVWLSDLFMERVLNNEQWTLFSPDDTPDLIDLYGVEFKARYEYYENLAQTGQIKHSKTMPAIALWRRMLSMLFETGHPWITFKDPCNLRSPQQHVGVVHSSNLCTEITLNTSEEEVAVCNLGSINLVEHLDIKNKSLNKEKLQETINTAVRMLDNVIDINFYPIQQARNSNLKHRPIGLGIMGFQDALYKLNIPYDSPEAIEFADRSMELISFYAISASNNLAVERGSYSTFENSLWSRGILPIDSIKILKRQRNSDKHCTMNEEFTLDWQSLREKIKIGGMRNSNVLAIAPTATISNICSVSQSIEPSYQNLFVKSNLSGEFTIINPYLVADLKALNLWDETMINDLKYFNGSVQQIKRIPQELKQKYATAFEVSPITLLEAAARRQKWIDQSQSLNLYIARPSGRMLDKIYKLAWTLGLKTTYYLRSLGATDPEKSTLNEQKLNAVKSEPSIDTNNTRQCTLAAPGEDECEVCQ